MLGAYDALGLPVVFGRCMLLQLKWPPVEDELQSPARQSSLLTPGDVQQAWKRLLD